jgi:hypothetical protein
VAQSLTVTQNYSTIFAANKMRGAMMFNLNVRRRENQQSESGAKLTGQDAVGQIAPG